jgi:hypothetical protein
MFGIADDAIRAFLEHCSNDEVSTARDEVRAILVLKLPEGELQKRILDDLGSCYYYPAEWS